MVKWIKLFSNQYLGFWLLGLVLFAIQEIPYMVMPLLKLKTNPIMNMTETSPCLDILEKILWSLCIALMVFIVNRNTSFFETGTGLQKIAFISMIVVLLLNFIGWGLYFKGYQSIGIMMFFITTILHIYRNLETKLDIGIYWNSIFICSYYSCI